MNDIVLAELNTARDALAKADTIQKTKQVLDVAVAAETYAKRQKLGAEAVMYATSIKVEALRQLGVMLKSTDRANGGVAQRTRFQKVTELDPPTLEEMGLDKKTSKLAQDIAALPEEQFEKVREGIASLHEAQKKVAEENRTKEREKLIKSVKNVKPSDRWNLYHADMTTWKSNCQYDFIITDPPYPREFVGLYEILAIRSKEWLKPGGLLVAMCGQSYLDEIYALMSKHIDYYWTAAYLTPGQPTPLRQVNVNTTWKPLLIFSNGKYSGKIFGDVFKSDGNDKDFHKWGQSVSGMYDIVSKMCLSGQSILDPFCGAGTTGIAALRHGCLFDGLDKDDDNINISKVRLSNES